MGRLEGIIEKNDVAYDAKAIGEDGKLIGITEMAVDILLFGVFAGSGLGGHKGISHLVRVNIGIILIEGF